MTPEFATDLAQYQRPGFKIVVGPEYAREVALRPLSGDDFYRLPGHTSWHLYDLHMRLGFTPSLWAILFGDAAKAAGHDVTDDEWRWLQGPATLEAAREWLREIHATVRMSAP